MPDDDGTIKPMDQVDPDNPDGSLGLPDLDSPVLDDPEPDQDTLNIDTGPSDDTDWKKRASDSTRYAQTEKQRADKAEAEARKLRERMSNLEQQGIKLDELEGILGIQSPGKDTPGDDRFVSKEQFDQTVQTVTWQMAKSVYVNNNPAFKDPNTASLLDFCTGQLMLEEQAAQGGIVTSTPDDILERAGKRALTLIEGFRQDGKKAAAQKRVKINKQGVTGGSEPPPSSADDGPAENYGREDHIKSRMSRQEKMRQGRG